MFAHSTCFSIVVLLVSFVLRWSAYRKGLSDQFNSVQFNTC